LIFSAHPEKQMGSRVAKLEWNPLMLAYGVYHWMTSSNSLFYSTREVFGSEEESPLWETLVFPRKEKEFSHELV